MRFWVFRLMLISDEKDILVQPRRLARPCQRQSDCTLRSINFFHNIPKNI